MVKKVMLWKTKGMNRDLSVSSFSPEFAYENLNLRLSTNDGNTLMSWVNEKGTKKLSIYNGEQGHTDEEFYLLGTAIGTAILDKYLVLFSTANDTDYIYRLYMGDAHEGRIYVKVLYDGKLDFDIYHPIETLVSYESDKIQKVYWTDGKNQPRVINIANPYHYLGKVNTIFDFVRELQLKEEIKVEKKIGASGTFAPGVIQYAFTYYDKYAQETGIFYTTPLYYISNSDRGGAPDGKVDNAFKITIENVDTNFEYLRIYSIQRTSLNGTPICKRIQDIAIHDITGTKVSFLDVGTSGNTIDPTELLYKGGDEIAVQTLQQKDGTLFLGNIKDISGMNEASLDSLVDREATTPNFTLEAGIRNFTANSASNGAYKYSSQLTATDNGITVPCSGFKTGDYYRLGVQFQYKTGKWSKPVFLKDFPIPQDIQPFMDNSGSHINVPIIKGELNPWLSHELWIRGYRRARAVVVFPNIQDRVTLCQGVLCPTLYTKNQRITDGNLYAQSSWVFRAHCTSNINASKGTVAPLFRNNADPLDYANHNMDGANVYNPHHIKSVEIQGDFKEDNQYRIDSSCVTFHSPDIEFDDALSVMDYHGFKGVYVGDATFTKTLSDIDIQTETPTISSEGGGFIHKSFVDDGTFGIISGLFYDDYSLDDYNSTTIGKETRTHSSFKWMVYLWNKIGSLNNDFTRPANIGNQSAKLKKKVISNLRYAKSTVYNHFEPIDFLETPQLFSSDECTILKLANDIIYQGNIDTMLVPDYSDGMYFAYNSAEFNSDGVETPFNYSVSWKTFSYSESEANGEGMYRWNFNNAWERKQSEIGNEFSDLALKKESVRIKYKSTPHLVFRGTPGRFTWGDESLPVFDIRKSNVQTDLLFGGQTKDAFRENVWLPCGNSVPILTTGTKFEYSYGDTYYQRWDCLKTYAFTKEDINQVVEIGSFVLETHVNIDGRYDRNRGQINNLNMSPQNFNLINPVYSQKDNFFSYKILDDDSYKNNEFPNQIIWSETKTNGEEIDHWTKILMSSVLDLDGDKGSINSIQRINDTLIAFQDKGIAQILYNENTQISTTEGIPIELANSGKVQGKRYISSTVGCADKWSICTSPRGIYFIDYYGKDIYLFNGQLQNISQEGGFNPWVKKNVSITSSKWDLHSFNGFRSFYDKLNQEVLFVNKDIALAWNEKVNTFTSFYSYGNKPFFCNVEDIGVWIDDSCGLWGHQQGEYCRFFDEIEPYSMTLIGNPDPQISKTFTNLEFHANVAKDGIPNISDTFDSTFDSTFHGDNSFSFFLPFTSLEVWNEYQHGEANFIDTKGLKHFEDTANIKRKYRIWRCDIPRDNYPLDRITGKDIDEEKGIYRYYRKPIDRMRNNWIYLKLHCDILGTPHKTEIHNIMMTYFE